MLKASLTFYRQKMLHFHPKTSKVGKVDSCTVIYYVRSTTAACEEGLREVWGVFDSENKRLRAGLTTPTFLVQVN
jgi:hypothetical protein